MKTNMSKTKNLILPFLISMSGLSVILLAVLLILKIDINSSIALSLILLALASVIIATIKVYGKNKIMSCHKKIYGTVLSLVSPFLISWFVLEVKSFRYMMLNTFILFTILFLLIGITQRVRISGIIVTSCALIFAVTNDVLIQVRGTALSLSDFYAIKTAMTVASNYKYHITLNIINAILMSAVIILLFCLCNLRTRDISRQLISLTACFVLSLSFGAITYASVNHKAELSRDEQWQKQDNNKYTGVCYNLVDNYINGRYKSPKGYSEKDVKEMLDKYTEDKNDFNPNIIVVMDESFGDMRNVADFTTSDDVMPFYDSLDENVMKGNAVVYGYGGGTCNSEYEFLTGLSTAFMPDETYVYLQYLNYNTQSLAWDLDSNIYDKIYIHPYIASNYRRSTVFKLLGFDKFYDGLSFSTSDVYDKAYTNRAGRIEYPGVDLLRDYISDKDVVDKIINIYENKDEDRRMFEFAVTMQNHGPYTYSGDDFKNTITINETPDNNEFNQYVSLLRMSDDQIKRLVEYFKNVDEDTIIVFFGDHQAYFNFEGLDKQFDSDLDKLKSEHVVPYFVWTNYDSGYKHNDDISLNYLQPMMKEFTGMSLTQADKLRLDVMKKYPIISTVAASDAEGNLYPSYKMIDDDLIRNYEMLEYYFMTGNK